MNEEIEGWDYVVCQICKKHFKSIAPMHLKHKHNMTMDVYQTLFPDAQISSGKRNKRLSDNRIQYFIDNPEARDEVGEKSSEYWDSNGAREGARDRMLERWRVDEDYRLVVITGNTGKTLSEEHKQAIRDAQMGNTNALGFKQTEDAKSKISKSSKGVPKSEEHKQALKEAAIRKCDRWDIERPGWRVEAAKRLHDGLVELSVLGGQSEPERQLQEILDNILPNEYKYVGDWQFILGNKCPDFMNVNGQKKLIEMYGDYWHSEDEVQPRIDHFKKYGFDTLIVWAHDLKDIENIKDLILNFNLK